MRQIEMKRRYRNVAIADCLKIGVFAALPRDVAAANPEDVPAPRVLHGLDRIGVHTSAEPRQPDPANLGTSARRQIDVEQRIRRKLGQAR